MGLNSKNKLNLRFEHDGRVLYEISTEDYTGEITIGRSQECKWVIPPTDRAASNHHASIIMKRGSFYVVDNKSRNGIFFEGAKIQERKLVAGEQIGIGDCRLYIEKPAAKSGGPEREFNQLEQLNGEKKGTLYDLNKPTIKIGSAADCDIIINDTVISHFHASIEQKADGSWIRDLGSRNGTKVNGTPLTGSANDSGRLLKDGDVITFSFIEMKFWDKYVPHVRSHLWLKVFTCVATFVLLVGGYWMWLGATPSAKNQIDLAREYARNCMFEQARAHLAAAANARQAERYNGERSELLTQVNQWEDTIIKWLQVKQLLADREWIDANKILSPLLSQNMELWRWNDTDANAAKNEALLSKQVLDAYLQARSVLEEKESTPRDLQASIDMLDKVLGATVANAPEFCSPLIGNAKDIYNELKLTTGDLTGINDQLKALENLEKMDEVIASIEGILGNAKKHIDARKKKRMRYSPKVPEIAENVLEPLYKLRDAKNVLDANFAAAASLTFDKINKKLPLPTNAECAVYPVMADKRHQLERLNKQFMDDATQLERIWKSFKSNSLEPGKVPDCIAILSNTNTLESVFNCDSLTMPLPKWTRKEPSGEYDRVLGIECFFEFLSQLPDAFDSAILEERPFVPDIFKARSLYGYMEVLMKFMERESLGMIKQQVNNNKVMELTLHVDDLLLQREAIVSMLKARCEQSTARDGIIAGGMAILLAKSNQLPTEFAERVRSNLRKIRQTEQELGNGEMTPEQIVQVQRKILSIGIPGDANVKRAWQAEHPSK